MATIHTEKTTELSGILSITIHKADSEKAFSAELKKYQKGSNHKGFRNGKTPASFIKKVYGKKAFVEAISGILTKELDDFRESANLVANPVLDEEKTDVNVNFKNIEDYIYYFDIGYIPEFEVELWSKDFVVTDYKVEIKEERIDVELDKILKNFGKVLETEESIIEKDLVNISIKELDAGDDTLVKYNEADESEDDNEGKNDEDDVVNLSDKDLQKLSVLKDGLMKDIKISPIDFSNDALKDIVLNLKKGSSFRFNIFDVESNKNNKHIRNYLLGIGEEDTFGAYYEATINSVERFTPAVLNDDFFEKITSQNPEAPKNEVVLRQTIKDNLKQDLNVKADSYGFRKSFKQIKDANNTMPLPVAFLNKINKEDIVSDEQLNYIRWDLIRGKLVKEHDIKVTQEDVSNVTIKQIEQYMQMGFSQDMAQNYYETLMKNEEHVRKIVAEITDSKLFDIGVKKVFTVEENPISEEDFNKLLEIEAEENKKIAEEAQAKKIEEEVSPVDSTEQDSIQFEEVDSTEEDASK